MAAGPNGVVDTTKVSGELGQVLETIAGASRFEMASLAKKLDDALDKLDRADTGGARTSAVKW